MIQDIDYAKKVCSKTNSLKRLFATKRVHVLGE